MLFIFLITSSKGGLISILISILIVEIILFIGSEGCGKTSLIKSTINEYYGDQTPDLNDILYIKYLLILFDIGIKKSDFLLKFFS